MRIISINMLMQEAYSMNINFIYRLLGYSLKYEYTFSAIVYFTAKVCLCLKCFLSTLSAHIGF